MRVAIICLFRFVRLTAYAGARKGLHREAPYPAHAKNSYAARFKLIHAFRSQQDSGTGKFIYHNGIPFLSLQHGKYRLNHYFYIPKHRNAAQIFQIERHFSRQDLFNIDFFRIPALPQQLVLVPKRDA